MPAALPKELRSRFARLIGEGLTGREAARRLQGSTATGGRWAPKCVAWVRLLHRWVGHSEPESLLRMVISSTAW